MRREAKALPWVLAAALVVAAPTLLWAACGAPDQAAPAAGLNDGSLWKGILNGLLAGAMASVAGWLKNRNTATGEQQRFDIKYLIPTVIVGALVGAVAAWFKKAPSDFVTSIEASPLFTAITLGAEYLFKIVWRHGVLHLRDMLSDLKAGAANPTPPGAPKP
jgi:hypothetical protein